MIVRTASGADRDIVESALWLDKRQFGLGSDFLDAVEETLSEILKMPLANPTLVFPDTNFKSALRWRAVGQFSHLAVFTVQSDEILVVAVLHKHRDLETILRERVGTG